MLTCVERVALRRNLSKYEGRVAHMYVELFEQAAGQAQ